MSLFRPTYGNAPNGLRPDLIELSDGLNRAFVRLPGGNYLERDTFAGRSDWKRMIGPRDRRPRHMGCWGYRSGDGLGLPEDMLWYRRLNAGPVFAGYTLKGDVVCARPRVRPAYRGARPTRAT